ARVAVVGEARQRQKARHPFAAAEQAAQPPPARVQPPDHAPASLPVAGWRARSSRRARHPDQASSRAAAAKTASVSIRRFPPVSPRASAATSAASAPVETLTMVRGAMPRKVPQKNAAKG